MEYKKINDVIIACRNGSDILYVPGYEDAVYDANVPWQNTNKEITRLLNFEFVYIDDPRMLENKKALKKTEIAAARYNTEIGGCTVDGVTIATDRGSQALLTAAVVTARLDPEFKTRWKCAGGHFVTLNAMQLRAIGDAVTAHVEACFAREAELVKLIDAAQTPEDLAAIQWSM